MPGRRPRRDALAAERLRRLRVFFTRGLVHTKGRWAGQPFTLRDWQWDGILAPLFGELRFDRALSDYVRRYRLGWLELGRKNGKSELLAGIALFLTGADGEEGAEVYGAAADREQARLVFNVAARMVSKSRELSSVFDVKDSRNTIVHRPSGSYYRVIAADAAGNLGQDPHGIIFDEVIAQRTRELWDALKSGMGARREPLMIAATTAGSDPHGFAANEHAFSERVATDPALDPSRFVYIRNMPSDADWTDEANWYQPNPALGDFLSLDVLRGELAEALANPATENRFRQFRCNQWVQQSTRWLPLHRWDESGGAMVDETKLAGRPCFGGLDLSSTQDTTALCWTFGDDDGGTTSVWRFWIPEDRVPDLDERTGGQASAWVRGGFIHATEGDVIDHESVLEQVRRDAAVFDIRQLAYDPNGAAFLVNRIIREAGVDCIQHDQHYGAMSPPTKEWEKRILAGRYRHGGQPVMRWQFDCIQVRADEAGRIRIDRKSSRDKVDGAVAAVMALSRLVAEPPAAKSRKLQSF